MVRGNDCPAVAIAADFGRKATKQTNKTILPVLTVYLCILSIA